METLTPVWLLTETFPRSSAAQILSIDWGAHVQVQGYTAAVHAPDLPVHEK